MPYADIILGNIGSSNFLLPGGTDTTKQNIAQQNKAIQYFMHIFRHTAHKTKAWGNKLKRETLNFAIHHTSGIDNIHIGQMLFK